MLHRSGLCSYEANQMIFSRPNAFGIFVRWVSEFKRDRENASDIKQPASYIRVTKDTVDQDSMTKLRLVQHHATNHITLLPISRCCGKSQPVSFVVNRDDIRSNKNARYE